MKTEETEATKDKTVDVEGDSIMQYGDAKAGAEHDRHESEVQDKSQPYQGQNQVFNQNLSNGVDQMSGFPNMQNMMGFGNMDFSQMMPNSIPGMNFPNMMGTFSLTFPQPWLLFTISRHVRNGIHGPNGSNVADVRWLWRAQYG